KVRHKASGSRFFPVTNATMPAAPPAVGGQATAAGAATAPLCRRARFTPPRAPPVWRGQAARGGRANALDLSQGALHLAQLDPVPAHFDLLVEPADEAERLTVDPPPHSIARCGAHILP